MRLLITGSRYWTDSDTIEAEILAAVGSALPNTVIIIHGGARGADTIAGQIARKHQFCEELYPADWAQSNAGPKRNQRMIDEGRPDSALAFPLPSSIGTRDCIRRIKLAQIPLKVVE